jgi:AbrB family looped-hinge helix DNA binding protein
VTETVLSVKGQIVLPNDIRRKLRLKPGQRFEVEAMSDGTILIIPIPDDVVGAMKLPNAQKLEKALREEREKDEKRERVPKKR